MKTETLIALRNLYYDGDRAEGEEFEAREDHIEPLVITGAAKIKNDSKAKRYNRRDLRAEN